MHVCFCFMEEALQFCQDPTILHILILSSTFPLCNYLRRHEWVESMSETKAKNNKKINSKSNVD